MILKIPSMVASNALDGEVFCNLISFVNVHNSSQASDFSLRNVTHVNQEKSSTITMKYLLPISSCWTDQVHKEKFLEA